MGTLKGKGGASAFVKTEKIRNGGTTMKYVCDVCGWIYDEEEGSSDNGIEPGTKWEELPDDFVCPVCMVGKDQFSKEV